MTDDDLIRRGDARDALYKAGYGASAAEHVIAALPAVAAPQGVDAVVEALTPSGDTKAAYMGEFHFQRTTINEDGDEVAVKTYVPWTTIKEIMEAIRERAALAPAQPAPQGVGAVAAALWKAEATDAGVPQSVVDRRTPEAFAEQSEATRDKWQKLARAALAALAPAQPAPQSAPDHVVKDAQAFDDMSRVADTWMHKAEGLQREIDMLSDPVAVHLNMLRGTIAKPSVEQIIHLYGVDALVAALAPVIVREAGHEPAPSEWDAAIVAAADEVEKEIAQAKTLMPMVVPILRAVHRAILALKRGGA